MKLLLEIMTGVCAFYFVAGLIALALMSYASGKAQEGNERE